MEPTKDSKNTAKTNKVEEPKEDVVVVDNIDKDATVVAGQSGDQPVTVVMNPPKKHKVGIIVGIVVFLLFLIGGGALAAWYFCIYNSPEVVAYDAMRQFITAEHVSTTGTVRIAEAESSDGFVNVAELKFGSSSMSLPSSTTVNLSISQRYEDNDQVVDDHEISLDLGVAMMSDGVIYLQVENLVDTFNKVLSAQDLALDDLDDMGQFAYALVELIDNQWWQISVGDILDELELGSSISDPVTDFYNCVLSAANERTDIAKLYNDHRFVNITKDDAAATIAGATRYQVTLDYVAMAEFANALPETAGTEKVLVCYNDLADEFGLDHISASSLPEVSEKQLEKALSGDYRLYLEISNFGHQLKRVEVESVAGDTKVHGDLGFNYATIEVAAPADYRPITDLFEEIFGLFGEYFYGLSGTEIYQDGVMII